MQKPIEIRPLKPKRNMIRQYCEECEEEATKEAVFDLENFVAVRRFCGRCVETAKVDFAEA
ncbi:hypothetical protein NTE_00238 [Candidatus Nitrososphaera evergladensis SR1]|uniref:Uncharacterized protein n=1 Tax=Candidatus Nitrososphaera evergladensis SR1 TaxID=1459636 RepID=A0A075MMG0_9ARCH|nr:hypothetical protein NTE_00238 [Candidatus Nitrososphaera evergladensis SR1]